MFEEIFTSHVRATRMSLESSEPCPFKLKGCLLASPLSPHRSQLWSLSLPRRDKLALAFTSSQFHALSFASSSSSSEQPLPHHVW